MLQWHAKGTSIVTTNYVLMELVALLTNPLRISRRKQIKTIETIKSASWVKVVHIDITLDEEGCT